MIVVRTLGAAEIAIGDNLLKPTSTKKFALLLYLAAERGRHTTRAVLQELLFPELPEKNARHALRELVYQLRQLGAPLEADNDGVGLPSEAVRSDYGEVMEAERLSDDQVRAVEGGFLPGYAPGHSESYSEWLEGLRGKVSLGISRRLIALLRPTQDSGDWTAAESLARACLAIDPLNEFATVALAETLALHGSHIRALDILERYEAETGGHVSTGTSTRRLHRRIREMPSSLRRSNRFVGRKREIALLSKSLEDCRETPHVTCLIGEPGIGKTRLAERIADMARMRGLIVAKASLSPGDEIRPMSAVTEILPQVMEKPGALGCSPESMSWIRRLLGPSAAGTTADMPPHESIAHSISIAVCDLIAAVSSEAPLVVLLDDIQWIDAASAKFLAGLTRSGQTRVLVLATGRSAPLLRQDDFSPGALSILRVSRLADDDCYSLAREELGGTTDEHLLNWIVEASSGNPFFLECLVRHLRETGERFAVPKRLTDFVDLRIRSLGEVQRHTLVVATLLGKRASIERLCHSLDMPLLSALSALSDLEADGLILNQAALEPRHWLIAESAIRTTEPIACRLIHHRIASILQSEIQSNFDPSLLWELSEHLIAAGEPRAASALGDCAKHAYSIGRARDAGELYLRAANLSHGLSRIQHLHDAIRAAMISTEADIVMSAYEALSEATREIPDDIYLSSLLARIAMEETLDRELPSVRRFFNDASRPISQRARAAWLFVIACEQDKRHDLIREASSEIANLWSSGDLDEITAIRLRLVFYSTSGERTLTPDLARRLLELTRDEPKQATIAYKRQAAVALTRSGLLGEACSEFMSAYETAASLGLCRTEQHLALMLAGVFNDLGDFEQGDHWLALSKEKIWGDQSDREGFIRLAIESDRLLRIRDWDALGRVAERAEGYTHARWTQRVRTWASSLELLKRHIAGECLDEDHLRRVTFAGQYEFGEVGETSDFRVATAANILIAQGKPEAADSIAVTYLRQYRRPEMPLLSSLGCLLTELDGARTACPAQLSVKRHQSTLRAPAMTEP